jgi:hypothetical protein
MSGATLLTYRVFMRTADGIERHIYAATSSRGHCLGARAYGSNVILNIHGFEYSSTCEVGHLAQLPKLLRNRQTSMTLFTP